MPSQIRTGMSRHVGRVVHSERHRNAELRLLLQDVKVDY